LNSYLVLTLPIDGMVDKKITDLEIEAILEAFSKSQPKVTDRTGQSSSLRV
jgi:hypothetical protein